MSAMRTGLVTALCAVATAGSASAQLVSTSRGAVERPGARAGELVAPEDTGTDLPGRATVLAASTTSDATNVKVTSLLLEIQPHEAGPIDVDLRILEPTHVRPIGTVVAGSGGVGQHFYSDQPGGRELFLDLLALGFRVVERRWRAPWFSVDASIRRDSARYALLLTWIHANVHTSGMFAATGNSGGSAEIAYALTTWKRSQILDRVVLSGGPPMSRLDLLCIPPGSPEWANIGSALLPYETMSCSAPVTPWAAVKMCQVLSSFDPDQLERDSILHPWAQLNYPDTPVIGLFGSADCTTAVPLGMLYMKSVRSRARIEFVPGAPHVMTETALGRAAIFQALLIDDTELGPTTAGAAGSGS
jgi:hypothetical protein